jgi:uncharacterized glyoxalase superfamily protein PhnB
MATAQQRTPAPASDSPPAALGGVVPYLNVSNAAAAADFYVKAFGAQEMLRYPPDEKGRTMHIHLHLNGGSLMLSDPFPEHGCSTTEPQGYSLLIPVKDIDAAFQRAVDAGATVIMPVQKMFWGDRYGQLRDPFGVTWAMNAPDAAK